MLLIGLELLACLAGKLVRENSPQIFSYFYSLCGGILLAKGLFCGLFDSISVDGKHTLGSPLMLFSLSFVALAAVNLSLQTGPHHYEQISASDGDEEEGLSVELGMLPAADDEEDSDSELPVQRPGHPPALLPLVWSHLIISMTLLAEGANGLLLGGEVREELHWYSKNLLQGILLCLVCGAVLEQTVSDPMEFVRAVALVIFSLPVGLLGGTYVTGWLGLQAAHISAYSSVVFPVAAGTYAAAAVLHMLPSTQDEQDKPADGPPRSLSARLLGPGTLRALSFIAGYVLTAATVRLAA